MQKVAVYRFRRYDISSDEYVTSRRWAILETINLIRAEALIHTERLVDPNSLNAEGMTERGFDPDASSGFQTRVR